MMNSTTTAAVGGRYHHPQVMNLTETISKNQFSWFGFDGINLNPCLGVFLLWRKFTCYLVIIYLGISQDRSRRLSLSAQDFGICCAVAFSISSVIYQDRNLASKRDRFQNGFTTSKHIHTYIYILQDKYLLSTEQHSLVFRGSKARKGV